MTRRLLALALLPLAMACGEKEHTEDSGVVDNDGDGVAADDDCDDDDGNNFPGNAESCDGADNNCNGTADEGVLETFYADADGDGFGDFYSTDEACEAGVGFVVNSDDCDDKDGDNYPGNTEVCDGGDNDCDGDEDEDDASDAATWYADSDKDGYGSPSDSTKSCDEPQGYVANDEDCDDNDDAVNPDADEICDGVDNDCDSGTSEDEMASRLDGAVYTDITPLVSGTPNNPEAYEVRKDVVFCDGTFYVNLEVTENVSVWGQNGAASTILDGAEEGPVVSILDDGLSVSLSDLTLTNGGPGDWEEGVGGGGVLCEGSDSSYNDLSLTNVVVAGNIFPDDEANYGGGVLGAWCDLDIQGSELSNNYAYLGGGMLAYYSDVVLDGSSISDNEGLIAAGVYQGYGTATYSDSELSRNLASLGYYPIYIATDEAVDLDDVRIDDNEAAYIGGAYIGGSSITWDGSGSGTASATGNSDDGETSAIYLISDSVAVTNVDFGTSTGGDDNSLWDLYSGGSNYWVEDAATFTCDSDGCGTPTETEITNAGSAQYSNSTSMWANVFVATTDGTIESFAPYAKRASSACYLQHFVLEASSGTSSSWTVIWRDTYTSASSSYGFVSVDVGIPVEAGKYYALAWRNECSSGTEYNPYDWTSGATGTTITDLGTTTNYLYKSGVTTAPALDSTMTGWGSSTGEFEMRVEGVDL